MFIPKRILYYKTMTMSVSMIIYNAIKRFTRKCKRFLYSMCVNNPRIRDKPPVIFSDDIDYVMLFDIENQLNN